VHSVAELRAGLRTLATERVDAIFMVSDGMVNSQSLAIADAARAHRLATIFSDRQSVAEGGLASYGASYHGAGRLAAGYVHRVLLGGNPAELPVINIDHLELVINARTAREIGLTIPPALLYRADEVLQ